MARLFVSLFILQSEAESAVKAEKKKLKRKKKSAIVYIVLFSIK